MQSSTARRSLTTLLQELQSTLPAALESCIHSQQSQNEPVVEKLRTVLVALLEGSVECKPVKRREVFAVVRVFVLVLDRLPVVFNGPSQKRILGLVFRLLADLNHQEKPLVNQMAQMLCIVGTTMLRNQQVELFMEFYYGAVDLLLDLEQLLHHWITPRGPRAQGPPPSLPLFDQFLEALNNPGSDEGGSEGVQEPDVLHLTVQGPTHWQVLVGLASELLHHLLVKAPLVLGPHTPGPVLVQCLAQLLTCAEGSLQVGCLRLLDSLARVLPSGQSVHGLVLQNCLWLVESWLAKMVELKDVTDRKEWEVALCGCLAASIEALHHQNLLELQSEKCVTLLVSACYKAQESPGMQILLLDLLARLARYCPPVCPLLAPLLHLLPAPDEVLQSLQPCLVLLGHGLGHRENKGLLRSWLQQLPGPLPNGTISQVLHEEPGSRPDTEVDVPAARPQKRRKITQAVTSQSKTNHQKMPLRKSKRSKGEGGGPGSCDVVVLDDDDEEEEVVDGGEDEEEEKGQGLDSSVTGEATAAKDTAGPGVSQNVGTGILLPPHVELLVTFLGNLSPGPSSKWNHQLRVIHQMLGGLVASGPLELLVGVGRHILQWGQQAEAMLKEVGRRGIGGPCNDADSFVAVLLKYLYCLASKVEDAGGQGTCVELLTSILAAIQRPCKDLCQQIWDNQDEEVTEASWAHGEGSGKLLALQCMLLLVASCKFLGVDCELKLLTRMISTAMAVDDPMLVQLGVRALPVAVALSSHLGPVSPSREQMDEDFPGMTSTRVVEIMRQLCDDAAQKAGASGGSSDHHLQGLYLATADSLALLAELDTLDMTKGLLSWVRPICSVNTAWKATGIDVGDMKLLSNDFLLPSIAGTLPSEQEVHPEEKSSTKSQGLEGQKRRCCPALSEVMDIYMRLLQYEGSSLQESPSIPLPSPNTPRTRSPTPRPPGPPDVVVAALASLWHFLVRGPEDIFPGSRPLLQGLVALVASSRAVISRACLQVLPCLLRPVVLLEAHGDDEDRPLDPATLPDGVPPRGDLAPAISLAEKRLLQELRGHLETANSSSCRIHLIQAAASLTLKVHNRDSEVLPLIMLVGCLDNRDMQVKAAAVELLDHLAAYHSTSLASLLLHSPHTRTVLEYVGRRAVDQPGLLLELSQLLEVPEVELVKAIVPQVIGWLCLNERRDCLELLAHKMSMSPATLFVNHADHAVAYAFSHSSSFPDFVTFVDELMAPDDFLAVVKVVARDVARQVILMAGISPAWGDDASLPTSLYQTTHMYLDSLATITGLQGKDGAADLLQGQTVALLLKTFGSKVGKAPAVDGARRGEQEAGQLQCIKALMVLIPLLGPYLGNRVPQIMAVLSEAVLQCPGRAMKRHALAAWCLFIQELARQAPQLLERVAAQTAVVLLGDLEEGGEGMAGAVAVLEELVIHQRPHLRRALQHMPPLPSVPALQAVNAMLAKEQRLSGPGQQLQLLTRSLAHESLSVRHAALGELKAFLRSHREFVVELVNEVVVRSTSGAGQGPLPSASSSSSPDHSTLLSTLMAALLRCCENAMRTHQGLSMKQRCAECLGLLGAVDPAHVKLVVPRPEGICSSGTDFLMDLVTRHLVRILESTTDIATLELTTFAIQELLQYYNTPSKLPDSMLGTEVSEGLFDTLEPDIQMIVEPYRTSKFTITTTHTSSSKAGPLFGKSQLSFRRWLYLWLRSMISNSSGPLQPAFVATIGVLKWDLPLMMFMLPYVVQNVVSHGSREARQAIRDEVMAVVKAAANSSTEVLEVELYAQCLFTLLDVLNSWVRDQRLELQLDPQVMSSSRSRGGQPSEPELPVAVREVADTVSSIPQELLAQAASRCGAHARALLYYEVYVREKYGGGLNPPSYKPSVEYGNDEVSFLIEVYSQLEEPDGLAGLIQLRQGGLTAGDQILAAEKAGAWSEALALYEQALAVEAHKKVPQGAEGEAGQVQGPQLVRARKTRRGVVAEDKTRLPLDDKAKDGGQPQDCLIPLQRNHLRCLLQMGRLHSLLYQVDGQSLRASGRALSQLSAAGVAAAWRLGSWDLLNEYLPAALGTNPNSVGALQDGANLLAGIEAMGGRLLNQQEAWEVCLGLLLSAVQSGADQRFRTLLYAARADIMSILPAISLDSYTRAYPHLVKLQLLQELDEVSCLMRHLPVPRVGERLQWNSRIRVMASTLTTQEPLLALRRRLAALLGDHAAAGRCWLQHAKLCRSTGHHEAAETAALEALAQRVPGAVLERAKLLWVMDKPHRAIGELQQAVRQLPWGSQVTSKNQSTTSGSCEARDQVPEDHHGQARLVLQLARWMAETGQGGKDVLTNLFEQSIQLDDKWEKAYFVYGCYLDQLYQDAKKRQTTKEKSGGDKMRYDRLGNRSKIPLGAEQQYYEYLPQVLENYGKSIERGRRHILQSLPRLLTLFFELGTEVAGKRQLTNKERNVHTQVLHVMRTLARSVPSSAWLLVLPQLISRISHNQPDVKELTHALVGRVLDAFPQQGLWSMAVVSKSALKARQEAANNIVMNARKRAVTEGGRRAFDQFARLADQLIKLCHWQPPSRGRDFPRQVSASREFGKLVGMLPVDVAVPVQSLFSVQIPPAGGQSGTTGPLSSTSPMVTIAGLRDEVSIMPSLQKPKKIVFTGSDGHPYPFLAKPKDDLRKDYRLMDFAGVMNNLFAREANSRRRNLYLRTYAVLPLTEDCGILQWVNNLCAFKGCCEEVYVAEGRYKRRESPQQIKKIYDSFTGTRRADLLDKVLQQLPPRLHRWFLSKFPEPASWLEARLSFTRTNAVWCMTGHMLGLGDRHGENILIDTISGDTFQVDFGCLFDRGLTLEVPEMVPFRLTQNVVDCFGVSGVEGTFRKCAEVTLKVLRQHKGTMMTSVETFLHDPLVEWSKGARVGGVGQGDQEQENPQALDALATIEGRLTGTLLGVASQPSLPLSCEGQAHRLIQEATDKENLGKMYVWWMPWF